MIRYTFLAVVLLCTMSIGCTTTQKQYYFGEYSDTLYDFEKNRTEDTLLEHKQQLEHIVAESKDKNLNVPPGIYAELGYIYMRQNNGKQAAELFSKEAELYPESRQFMDRLIRQSDKTKI